MKQQLNTLLIVAFYLISFEVLAQQSASSTQFMFNKSVINPSSVSDGELNCASLFYRSQWLGFEGAPEFYGLTYRMPKLAKNMGAGVNVYKESLGKYSRIRIEGDYSYSVLFEKGVLSMGVKLAVNNLSFTDLNWIAPDTDPGTDPAIVTENNNSWSPSFGIGLQFSNEKWYSGFAILNLTEQNNSFLEVKISQKRQYFFTGGYNIRINSAFKLVPNVMFRTDLAAYGLDLNLNSVIDDKILVGVNYRYTDSFSMLLGYRLLDGLNIRYSYDFGTNKIGSFDHSKGSHELNLSYCFSFSESVKKSKKNRNVRFL